MHGHENGNLQIYHNTPMLASAYNKMVYRPFWRLLIIDRVIENKEYCVGKDVYLVFVPSIAIQRSRSQTTMLHLCERDRYRSGGAMVEGAIQMLIIRLCE